MDLFTRVSLEKDQFQGFVRLQTLDAAAVPSVPGTYMVVRESAKRAIFLDANPGGRFKSQNPTVPISTLAEKWVHGCSVIYIGKATNLSSRLQKYRDFGLGKRVSHWGGRYIWQIADARELVVCWKPTLAAPRDVEKALLARFQECYGQLPFANLIS